MDLKRRLAQLDRLTGRKRDAGREPQPDPTTPPTDPEEILSGLGLIRQETAAGPIWFREYEDEVTVPVDPLPDLRGLFPSATSDEIPLTGVLLLDTETTGLAGGTGTLVFQLGVSWWRQGHLHTRQYFLPGPAGEPALLADLARLSTGFTHLVTYNGASFDLPLLRTRALLNRMADPLRDLVGWDLLVPARRLWGYRLDNCRQQTVESHLCGEERGAGDIDGACIPQVWFDFLRTGQPGLLGRVLTHNHRDMLGMAAILERVCRIAAGLGASGSGPDWPVAGLTPDRLTGWALGRVCERRGEHAAAATYLARAWEADWPGRADQRLRRRFRRDAVRMLKRQRWWDLVEEVIHDGLECDSQDVEFHTEAAILYEHRMVDLARAHRHACQTGDGHRIARLERLLGRTEKAES